MADNILWLATALVVFLLLAVTACGEICPVDCITCTSANICSTCVRGKYGAFCEKVCSTYCNCDPSDDSQICKKSSGACIHGCVVGYWGDSCTIECAKGCLGEICNQTTGTCLYGCKANFYGHRCGEEEKSSTSTDLQNSNKNNCEQNNRAMVALYVVTSISVLVAAASVTGIVLLLNRRRFCREQGNHNISSSPFQDVSDPELENQDYQNSNRMEDSGGTYNTINDDYETDDQFG